MRKPASSQRFRPGRASLALLFALGLLAGSVAPTLAAAPRGSVTLWAQPDDTTARATCGQPDTATGTAAGSASLVKHGDKLTVTVTATGLQANTNYYLELYDHDAACAYWHSGGFLAVANANGAISATMTLSGARGIHTAWIILQAGSGAEASSTTFSF